MTEEELELYLEEKFAALFDGYKLAHGEYRIKYTDDRGKAQGSAVTVQGPIKWDKHLSGQLGQGVIPLREDNDLMWGAIDIDKYDVGIVEIVRRVQKYNLPLVACETKSKGVHLYLFLEFPHPAQLIRDRLGEWAAKIGFGGSEIFPKQSYRATTMDIGNWLNMPYFGDTRRCWNGEKWLSKKEFVESIEPVVIDQSQSTAMEEFATEFEGAPPCICHFERDPGGVPDGHRHNTILTLLVYCRKRWPDTWLQQVYDIQSKIFKPPLSQADIESKVKSMSKKAYDLKCDGPWCDKTKCRRVKYGRGDVAGGEGNCEIGSVTKLVGEPVLWIVEVEGTRVVCTTDQLYSQHLFNKLCMDTLSRCPGIISNQKWMEYLDSKIRTADIIHSPAEATPEGIFRGFLETFLNSNFIRCLTIDEVTLDRVYVDQTNVAHFKSATLFSYLDEQRYKAKSPHQIWQWLRNMGCSNVSRVINGRNQNVWAISLTKSGLDTSSDRKDPRLERGDETTFD